MRQHLPATLLPDCFQTGAFGQQVLIAQVAKSNQLLEKQSSLLAAGAAIEVAAVRPTSG